MNTTRFSLSLRLLVSSILVISLAACIVPTALPSTPTPPSTSTAVEPTTAVPTQDITPEATATEAAATVTPTVEQGGAPVITRENLSGLSQQVIAVPEMVSNFLWPAADAPLPGAPDPRPDLLLQAGPVLHPILLDPIGLGQPLELPLNGTESLAFAPDATAMVIRDPSRTALYSLDGPIIRELPQPANLYGASFSSDGRYLVLTSADTWEANVYDLDADPASAPVTLTGFETAAPVYGVEAAPGGQLIAWHARATLHLQDLASGQMGAKLSYEDFITDFAFSPDGSKLALAAADNLYLYSLPDASEIAKLPLSGPLSALGWSPDGTLLAAGYAGGLSIWDGGTLEPLISLPGPNTFTGLVAFSPDGRYIVSMHDNNLFGVWKTQ